MKKLIFIIACISLVFGQAQGQDFETVKAKYSGKPIIQMTLNNKKTWVLLDTGSEYTVLDSRMKDEFEFHVFHPKNNTLNVSGLGSTNNQLMETSHADLQFGHVRLKGRAFAYDLSSIANSIEKRTGKRITAIIGTHMMRSYGFVIDMRRSTATLCVKSKKRNRKDFASEEMIIAKNAKFND